jgi:hypothetical protein
MVVALNWHQPVLGTSRGTWEEPGQRSEPVYSNVMSLQRSTSSCTAKPCITSRRHGAILRPGAETLSDTCSAGGDHVLPSVLKDDPTAGDKSPLTWPRQPQPDKEHVKLRRRFLQLFQESGRLKEEFKLECWFLRQKNRERPCGWDPGECQVSRRAPDTTCEPKEASPEQNTRAGHTKNATGSQRIHPSVDIRQPKQHTKCNCASHPNNNSSSSRRNHQEQTFLDLGTLTRTEKPKTKKRKKEAQTRETAECLHRSLADQACNHFSPEPPPQPGPGPMAEPPSRYAHQLVASLSHASAGGAIQAERCL